MSLGVDDLMSSSITAVWMSVASGRAWNGVRVLYSVRSRFMSLCPRNCSAINSSM